MKKNRQKGFSLMEVLVTIGLLSIITGISVPSYRNYIRVSKTAEAQSSLGQVYMAEKSFFLQHRFYTTDLLTVGVAPDGEMMYNVGFGVHSPDKPATYAPSLATNAHNFYLLCGGKFREDGNTDCGDAHGCVPSCAFQSSKLKAPNGTPPNPEGTFIPPNVPAAATTVFAPSKSFKAYAIADLINKTPQNPTDTVDKDVWCINEYKQVSRVRDGTRKGNPETPCP